MTGGLHGLVLTSSGPRCRLKPARWYSAVAAAAAAQSAVDNDDVRQTYFASRQRRRAGAQCGYQVEARNLISRELVGSRDCLRTNEEWVRNQPTR